MKKKQNMMKIILKKPKDYLTSVTIQQKTSI